MSPEPDNRPGLPPSSGLEWWRWRGLRWTATVIAVIALPKCLLCAAGYVALATGLVSVAPELCGPSAGQDRVAVWTRAVALGLILAGSAWFLLKWRRPMSGKNRGDR
jgi:hypothetical protein